MTKGGRLPVAGAPTLAVWIYVLIKELTVSIKAWSGYQRRYQNRLDQAHSDTG